MCKVNYAFIVKLIMPLILLPAVVTGSGVWLINAVIGGLNSRSTASDGVMALTMRRNCVYMTPDGQTQNAGPQNQGVAASANCGSDEIICAVGQNRRMVSWSRRTGRKSPCAIHRTGAIASRDGIAPA